MKEFINKYNFITKTIFFAAIPLLLWYLGDVPLRSTFKESISILTILAFSAMIGQFYLTRGYRTIHKELKVSNLVRVHKFFGYIFIPILFIHPFLIVLPRYFESSVEPMDAFWTIITQFNSIGIILGLTAWTLMIAIGTTSFLRSKLMMGYKTWRILHGVLSISFIAVAAWHVIDLGRHSDLAMSIFFVVISIGGIILLFNTYFLNNHKSGAVGK